MALSSMTGFARVDGASGAYAWGWELKSLNAKGLELRLRAPPAGTPSRCRCVRNAPKRSRAAPSTRISRYGAQASRRLCGLTTKC